MRGQSAARSGPVGRDLREALLIEGENPWFPDAGRRSSAEEWERWRGDAESMQDRGRQRSARYAVVFREGTSAPMAGALVVDDRRLLLVGRRGDDRREVSVPYSVLREVRIGRSREERLNGHPALVLGRRDAPSVQIEPFGVGLLRELADLLAALATEYADSEEQVAVIVPLKAGYADRAKELVAQGPPFDPGALGLERHEVFVTAREAVFVFAGPDVREKLERATQNPTLWRAGLAWRACMAGRARLSNPLEALPTNDTEPAYRWVGRSWRSAGSCE